MIKVLYAPQDPLLVMGTTAAYCWNSTPKKSIAIDCMDANHGRVLEFVDVTLAISEYSARVIREVYTHSIGVSKLQESTRYVDSGEFDFYIPDTIKSNPEALLVYKKLMGDISNTYKALQSLKIPKEDIANILPLGMHTKVAYKINLRSILNMFEVRTCSRAYKEYRIFMEELKSTLSAISSDWEYIMEKYAKTKCDVIGYCNEKKSCGKYPKLF